MNGIAGCVMRVASTVVVTAVCSHSLHVPRGSERDMEMGMSWATPISARVEERRGQGALPAPLARANFQTSFNLI